MFVCVCLKLWPVIKYRPVSLVVFLVSVLEILLLPEIRMHLAIDMYV